MAYKISTRVAFANTVVGTTAGTLGGTSLSDPIDLRDISRIGNFSLSYLVTEWGGMGSAGTTAFSYRCSESRDGTYLVPAAAGDIGTATVVSGNTGIVSFSPVVTPFMKICAITGTSGPATVSAVLNVR